MKHRPDEFLVGLALGASAPGAGAGVACDQLGCFTTRR